MDLYQENDYYQNIKTIITPDIKELQKVEQAKLQDLDISPVILFSLGTNLVRPRRTPPKPDKTKTPPPTPPGGFGWSLGGVEGSGIGRKRRKGYSIRKFNVLKLIKGNKTKKTKKSKKKKGWAFL